MNFGDARTVRRGRLLLRRLSEHATRLLCAGAHQVDSTTCLDRYPALFNATRSLLQGRARPRILSFGCASGEEVVTLRRYFPDAEIVGLDINPLLLRACRSRALDDGVIFVGTQREAGAGGTFDAIFCMAVLTRRPHEVERRGMTDISAHYPFAAFAATVRDLADMLNDGGLLIVEHTLYRVEDAIAGTPLVAVASHGVALAKGPRFAPSGRRLDRHQLIARIFRRRGAGPSTGQA